MLQVTPQQVYQRQQIEGANPLELILMAYDAAVVACTRRDLAQTTKALAILRNGLDFSQGEIAVGLLRLYQYCADLARQGKFDEAVGLLRELRETWAEARDRQRVIA
ncbi:MAG TPA: flagellar protein FliS [Anaerolineae bacterium]|nr:flagellar protein FliS [Anaerolineae bacterium]HIQ04929.1 flagellar protein FliS [Anaerolineae bacterium]